MSSLAAAPTTPDSQVVVKHDPGYESTRNVDGTWTIRDVEIFAEHERGDFKVDKTWLESAVARAALRHAEGYLPPLHIQHHGRPGIRSAGKFLPKAVVERVYEGQPRHVILADLLEVPDEEMPNLSKGRYPYRSVEILDTKTPEIDSMALLDHEVPYFRFRNLKPNIIVTPPNLVPPDDAACQSEDFAGQACNDAVVRRVYNALGATSGYAALLKFALESHNESGYNDNKESANDDVSSLKSKVKAKFEILCKHLDEAAKEMGVSMDENENTERGASDMASDVVQGGPAEMNAPAAEITTGLAAKPPSATEATATLVATAAPVSASEYSELLGRMRGLETKLAAQEKSRSVELEVASAARDLAKYGCSDEVLTDLRDVAARQGPEGVKTYVAAVKRFGTPDPENDALESSAGVIGGVPGLPAELATEFSATDPEDQREALVLYNQWKAAPDFMRAQFTAKEYINAYRSMDRGEK